MQTIVPVVSPRVPNFVFTDHTILCNHDYPGGSAMVDRWAQYLPYERATIRAAQAVFTMSERTRQSVIERYAIADRDVFSVGGGIDVKIEGPFDPMRYERQNIVFVGYDWERKGGPELLQAFSRVRTRLPAATLTIVGASPRDRGPGVEVVGPVPREAVGGYLSRASVFCMPSRREPFGLAFLEAMYAGLPVVALRLGAVPDFVTDGETGYLVAPDDIEGLADRLTTLLRDPVACRDFGARARALVASRYTWEHVQKAMWRVISERCGG